MVKKTRGRRAVLIPAIVALLAMPQSALADPNDPVVVGPEKIDSSATGSITITKLVAPEQLGDAATGEDEDVQGIPIEGVTFTIEQVTGVNLTTPVGWTTAATMTPTEAAALISADPEQTLHKTDADGVIKVRDLNVGLYLVTEIDAPAGVPETEQFLVTVPTLNPGGDKWIYDVHVYPKNEKSLISKTVSDADVTKPVKYTVTIPVPPGTTSVTITDIFDKRLVPNVNSLTLAHAGDPAPSPIVDYDEQFKTLNGSPLDTASNTLTVKLPEVLLDAISKTTDIGFSIEATVNSPGVITNDASYEMIVGSNVYSGTSAEVTTMWGQLTVNKLDAASGDLLDGATFAIAASEDAATEGPYIVEPRKTVNGTVTFTLRYSDFADNQSLSPAQTYWLVETDPPEGYQPDKTPREFKLLSANKGEYTIVVHNAPERPFALPAIGGNRAVLPIIAVVLAGGGVLWLVRSRRVND
ncbi:SpaH/EbpB family LPXTG-anchored major pilin [Xylanimonas ulmi]|uniref:SpaH/EbpB family LPXTG-anchored major pilin n=1 Tax=Xylanimonas ulmi TaxID=228973 RepID=UPI00102C4AA5|nr:SpaH/EbpB family LPXTG-anchored major pilin [Xylanibacterium ulmi]